jgi:hypothetical protein
MLRIDAPRGGHDLDEVRDAGLVLAPDDVAPESVTAALNFLRTSSGSSSTSTVPRTVVLAEARPR